MAVSKNKIYLHGKGKEKGMFQAVLRGKKKKGKVAILSESQI